MCGMTCTGMLMSLSEKIKPTWFDEVGSRRFCRVLWNAGSADAVVKAYSVSALIEGLF